MDATKHELRAMAVVSKQVENEQHEVTEAAASSTETVNAEGSSEMRATQSQHLVDGDALSSMDDTKVAAVAVVPPRGRWRRGSLSLPLGNDDNNELIQSPRYVPSPLHKQLMRVGSSENVADNAQFNATASCDNKRIVSPRAAAALAAARKAKEDASAATPTDSPLDEHTSTPTNSETITTPMASEYYPSSGDEMRSPQQDPLRNRRHHPAAFRRRFASSSSTSTAWSESSQGSPTVSPSSLHYQSSPHEPMLAIDSRFSPTDRPRSNWNSDSAHAHHVSPPSRPPSLRRHHRSRSFSHVQLGSAHLLASPKTHPSTTRAASGSMHDDSRVMGGGSMFKQDSYSSTAHSPPPQPPSTPTTTSTQTQQQEQQQQQQQQQQPVMHPRRRLVRCNTHVDTTLGLSDLSPVRMVRHNTGSTLGLSGASPVRRNSDVGAVSRSSSSGEESWPFANQPHSPSASSEEAEEKDPSVFGRGGGSSSGLTGALDDERLESELDNRDSNGSIGASGNRPIGDRNGGVEPALGLGHLPEWIHHNTIKQRRNSSTMNAPAPETKPALARANSMGNVSSMPASMPNNFGSFGFSPSSASSSSSSIARSPTGSGAGWFNNNNNALGLGQQDIQAGSNQFSAGSPPSRSPTLVGRRFSASVLENGNRSPREEGPRRDSTPGSSGNRSPREYTATAFSKLDESAPSTNYDLGVDSPPFAPISTLSPLAAHRHRAGSGNPFARSASARTSSVPGVGGALQQEQHTSNSNNNNRNGNPFARGATAGNNGVHHNLPPAWSPEHKGSSMRLMRSQSSGAENDYGEAVLPSSAAQSPDGSSSQVYDFALWRNALGSSANGPSMHGSSGGGGSNGSIDVGGKHIINNTAINVSNNGHKFIQNNSNVRMGTSRNEYGTDNNNNTSPRSFAGSHGDNIEAQPPRVPRLARHASAPSVGGMARPRAMSSGEGLAAAAATAAGGGWTQSHAALSCASATATSPSGTSTNDNDSEVAFSSPRLVPPTALVNNSLLAHATSSSALARTPSSSTLSRVDLTTTEERPGSPVTTSAAAPGSSSGYRRSMSIDTSARATGVATISRQHLLHKPTTCSPRTRARKYSVYDPSSSCNSNANNVNIVSSNNNSSAFQYSQTTSPPPQQQIQEQLQQQTLALSSSQSQGRRMSAGSLTSPPFEWRRGEQLGHGTFGTVYLALNQNTGGLFAVKQVPILSSTPQQGQLDAESVQEASKQIEDLQQEIDVMRKLEHPHIVSYISSEWDKEGRVFNIFLEYVPGGSLSSILNQFGPLQEHTVRLYTNHIVSGVQYLHEKGIAHRDIKGANVLVNDHGIAKLADFGCSKQFAGMQTKSSLEASRFALKGSIPWLAPEAIQKDKSHGRKSDIWSLGCTVIEMMTAKLPWPDTHETAPSILFQLATKQKPPMPECASPVAQDFILLCLESDPVARATAGQLSSHNFLAAETA